MDAEDFYRGFKDKYTEFEIQTLINWIEEQKNAGKFPIQAIQLTPWMKSENLSFTFDSIRIKALEVKNPNTSENRFILFLIKKLLD